MSAHHIPDEDIENAADLYRVALNDAADELGSDANKDRLIELARELLRDEDEDAADIVEELADSDFGDVFWQIEAEITEDRLDRNFSPTLDDENAAEQYLN